VLKKESLNFLKRMLSTPSPSGCEQEIQKVCRDYASRFANTVYKDVHGNQFHVVNPNAPVRVMLAGHVDEISLMVNTINNDGFITFVAVGGVDGAVLGGQRVIVHGSKGPVPGVIGRKAIHLMGEDERGKPLQLHEMWVDIGAKDRRETERLCQPGDPITIDQGFQELRNNLCVARAMDDRIGAFVCLEALRLIAQKKPNVAVFCITTVQEEIGLRGATTSTYGCNPHAGIAVDVGWATDHPRGDADRWGLVKLGQGPIISKGPNINPVVLRQLNEVARKKNIPLQHRAAPRPTGTDANTMQLSRGGVATAVVGIPNRYMHTPVEMISLDDVEHAINLIAEWVLSLKANVSFIP
jgi:putative aminopeptidase FrvX